MKTGLIVILCTLYMHYARAFMKLLKYVLNERCKLFGFDYISGVACLGGAISWVVQMKLN